jgi:hypothetical protein
VTNFELPDDSIDIKDFTLAERFIRFRAEGDVFEAYSALGLATMQRMVNVSKSISSMVQEEKYDAIVAVFDEALTPESAKRFRERALSSDGEIALDVKRQLIPILHFLLEKYGLRPTQQSSD